jgi:integrase
MASIKPRNGSWRATVSLGRGQRVTETFDTKGEAEAWAKRQESKKAAGNESDVVHRRHTVKELFEIYLDDVSDRSDTAKQNRLRLTRFGEGWLGKLKVIEVVPATINKWVRERYKQEILKVNGESFDPPRFPLDSTVRRELNLISAAFTYAVNALKWIKENPCHESVEVPKGVPRNRPLLTAVELAAIRASTGYRDDAPPLTSTARTGAAFFLALETGMRSGEILRIKPEHYFRERGVVLVAALESGGRKGSESGRVSSAREVPLTDTAIQILDNLLASMPEKQRVKGKLKNPPYILGIADDTRDALWRKARDRAGIEDLHYHDTKHEACTRLAKFLDVIELSLAIGTKDVKLLRDTYYVNRADESRKLLPSKLATHA